MVGLPGLEGPRAKRRRRKSGVPLCQLLHGSELVQALHNCWRRPQRPLQAPIQEVAATSAGEDTNTPLAKP